MFKNPEDLNLVLKWFYFEVLFYPWNNTVWYCCALPHTRLWYDFMVFYHLLLGNQGHILVAVICPSNTKIWYSRVIYPCSGKVTRGNVERYRQARNRQVAVFKLKKRQHEDRDCAEMEQLFRANESRKFYEKVNRSRKGFVPRADVCRDNEGILIVNKSEVLDRWKQYFNEHLNGDEANEDGDGVNLGASAADEQFPAPDLETVKREIRKLKNNRAAGKDRLPGELFEYGGEKLARALHCVISKIWEEEKLPEEWMDGVVCPIYKRAISWTAATTAALRLSTRPTKSSPRSSAVSCHPMHGGSWGPTTGVRTKYYDSDRSSRNVVSTTCPHITSLSTSRRPMIQSTASSYGRLCTRTDSRIN
ncbi:uncharacterized protein LOC128092465 [Culex pipiens pallens]|uniref:uncharacterized protein LOC128092465 n=1 Tax=Culex pipiens pallens TaxID=42434 RepID=UPI0022AB2A94|nr:uncharacterized protein LOC128092465 [Culex pipiens pallens]